MSTRPLIQPPAASGLRSKRGKKRVVRTRASQSLASLFSRELVTLQELEKNGYSRTQVTRMKQSGQLERIGRGLYRQADAPVSEHHDLKVAISQTTGKGVVVLLSALQFHHIGTQVAHEVWLQIPAQARKPVIAWPPVRLVRSRSKEAFTTGVETHLLGEMKGRVTSPARTVADCFKFRKVLGLETCLEALREVLRRHRMARAEIVRYARQNRVLTLMKPYLEALA